MLKQEKDQELSEINVTPFIDVMLVLLIIFMVVTPLMTTSVKAVSYTHLTLPTKRIV